MTLVIMHHLTRTISFANTRICRLFFSISILPFVNIIFITIGISFSFVGFFFLALALFAFTCVVVGCSNWTSSLSLFSMIVSSCINVIKKVDRVKVCKLKDPPIWSWDQKTWIYAIPGG